MALRLVLLAVLAALILVACDDGDADSDGGDRPTAAASPEVTTTSPTPAAGLPANPPTDATAEAEAAGERAYLALGDSVAVGIGAGDVSDGYPAVVFSQLQERGVVGELINLAVSGETTGSMRAGGQLVAALQALEERNGNEAPEDDVALVTLTIGGNDAAELYGPCAGGPTEQCLRSAAQVIEAFRAGLESILQDLTEAAGEATTIVVTTYYNPLRHSDCLLTGQADLADEFLEGGPVMPGEEGFNDVIREVADEADAAVVADLFGLLGEAELVPDCLHPTAAGHRVIAAAVLNTLETEAAS